MVADPKNTVRRPLPEEHQDYRSYLTAMIQYLKATRPQFSYRYFSRIAGFSSPNFLKLVAEGKRNLSPGSIPKFARGLGLDERERDAFETLVLLTQARTDEDRNRYYTRLRRTSGGNVEARRLESDQFDVYSLWYALPIRELLLHPEFKEDPVWIGRRLRPRVAPADVRRAIVLLERVGLIVRDAEGRLLPADTKLSTGPRVRSLAVRNFHRAMLELAQSALEEVAVDDRDMTSLTLSLTASQYRDIRARIERFRREILDLVDDAPKSEEAKEVYQLGFQLFPLTNRREVP